ncbi:transcriptional regulator [Bradyrhizobium zhanjiangense]|uniref:Transcriptional regulator n=1 Tax=Bradyrhizobium zhanjiangense TaxID=1325107 RepID=A0A4Q0SX19_9BRAD|nr:transcriptional regulator [Bradyrhizobium zhanjiangense]
MRVGGSVNEVPLILVVEDEYLLRRDMEEILTGAGFAGDSFPSGETALASFMDNAKTYKALITDVNLGDGLNGWEVARRIREKEAGFPVIYITAYSAAEWTAHGVPNSILISKPFAPTQLVTALSNLLNVGSAPTT